MGKYVHHVMSGKTIQIITKIKLKVMVIDLLVKFVVISDRSTIIKTKYRRILQNIKNYIFKDLMLKNIKKNTDSNTG